MSRTSSTRDFATDDEINGVIAGPDCRAGTRQQFLHDTITDSAKASTQRAGQTAPLDWRGQREQYFERKPNA
jgi:hypothetical protein